MDEYISRSELQSEIAKCASECRIKAFDPSVNCILQIIHRLPSADVQSVNQWISVKDRLPDIEEGEVLVWIKGGKADGMEISDCYHIGYWVKASKVFCDMDWDVINGITH